MANQTNDAGLRSEEIGASVQFTERQDSPTREGYTELKAIRMSGGRVEIQAQGSHRKTLGAGRYHTESVSLVLTDEQRQQLRKLLDDEPVRDSSLNAARNMGFRV